MSTEARGIDSDLIRGHIDTIILKVLKTGDRYGYEIIKDVETKSQGTYELKQPTLYSCLKRLEGQGLISSYWTDSDIGGKRHYYKLTEKGKENLEHNQNEWFKSKSIIDSLIYEDDVLTPSPVASNSESSDSIQKTEPVQEIVQEEKSEEEPIVVEAEELANISQEDIDHLFGEISQKEQETEDIFKDQLEAIESVDFVPSFSDNDTEEEVEESIEQAKENEEELETSHFVFQELEQKRIEQQLQDIPTPLELVAEQNQEAVVSNQQEDEELFSTFADESRRQRELAKIAETEQQKANEELENARKQAALEVLYQNTDLVAKSEPVQDIQEETQEPIEKQQQIDDLKLELPETIESLPQEPTFEQRQTLKMFEGNKVNAAFTESTYKNRLSELSQYASNTRTFASQTRPRGSVEYNPQDHNDIKKRFEQFGISVRVHQKLEKVKEEKTHIFTNKIRLARAWTTFCITALLLAISIAIFCATSAIDMSISKSLPIYLSAFLVVFTFPVVTTIIYWCDPQKRKPARYAPRISLIASCLFFIEALVITYAINLQTGFVSFAQKGYNHLGWIVPWIASTAILISSITYYFMYRSKKFHS